jgi:TetR/AcrR family tetracycline transcriptional repressor
MHESVLPLASGSNRHDIGGSRVVRHNQQDVIRAALALLDETGFESVTLRGVAKRMGLHLNSVTFQVKNKARLFELMADAILGELSVENLSPDPRERIRQVTLRVRTAMLSHRDGGRVIAGTDTADANALRNASIVMSAFSELGISRETAARASFALHCLVTGLVQEEQTKHETRPPNESEPGEASDLADLSSMLFGGSFPETASFGIDAVINEALLVDAAS